MRRTGLRVIYQKPRTTVPGEPSERFPCLVDLRMVTAVDQVWATDITYIPLQKGSSTWWRLWICSPGTCSARSSPTAWIRSSVSMLWRCRWEAAAGQRSSTPTRAVSSPPLISWAGYKEKESRSAGQGGSAATTTSWWRGCGEWSNTRRCSYALTAMAGTLKSGWHAFSGGTAM